eukprot:CAMPEP_0206562128 /NCGR_PEP_ID=MMETSP0325_2-20121206/22042_1 /ASSEMBLY_ACC=CAM_ASM_000347 /TAXON_ID=2866 /ORGANISM="Crypthecodinium cohnii, Strain Seligo" /LENGTH=393 /DNA_ID=CAMNT_0054064235 /DNA_START=68 /DNA_END=1246 /DNA_ORIENTATION=-
MELSRRRPSRARVADVLALSLWLLAACPVHGDGPYEVECSLERIPGLRSILPFLNLARICYPTVSTANGSRDETAVFPLHLFAHGDAGGGAFFYLGYGSLQHELASHGFVVPAYLSCWFDSECNNGQESFLEALKLLDFMEQNPTLAPVDWSKSYSASGHSTGGRVVLMLASIRDNPAYLANTSIAPLIKPSYRRSLQKLRAVIGDFPDPMYNVQQNPDIANFRITETPVFIITGSNDYWIEPSSSGWADFMMTDSKNKVFICMHGAGHLEPTMYHSEGPFIAYFAQYYALGNVTAGRLIYGDGPGTLQKTLPLAEPGDHNRGDNTVSFLACSEGAPAVPLNFEAYCSDTLGLRAVEVIFDAYPNLSRSDLDGFIEIEGEAGEDEEEEEEEEE